MHALRGTFVLAVVLAGGGVALPAASEAVKDGAVVGDVRLKTLDGGVAPLVDPASAASVLLFFRSGQDRSVEALRVLSGCQHGLSKKPVRVVGMVSGGDPAADVRAAVASAGAKLPVLLDEGDAVYARLGVRVAPAIFVLDRSARVVAFEAYRQVGLCDEVRAHVQRAVGEISDAELARALAPAESQLPGEDPLGVAARHVKFGRKLLASGAVAMAHENARKSLGIAPSAGAWVLEGDAFKAEGRCGEAVKAYEAALKLDGSNAGALAGRKGCAP